LIPPKPTAEPPPGAKRALAKTAKKKIEIPLKRDFVLIGPPASVGHITRGPGAPSRVGVVLILVPKVGGGPVPCPFHSSPHFTDQRLVPPPQGRDAASLLGLGFFLFNDQGVPPPCAVLPRLFTLSRRAVMCPPPLPPRTAPESSVRDTVPRRPSGCPPRPCFLENGPTPHPPPQAPHVTGSPTGAPRKQKNPSPFVGSPPPPPPRFPHTKSPHVPPGRPRFSGLRAARKWRRRVGGRNHAPAPPRSCGVD